MATKILLLQIFLWKPLCIFWYSLQALFVRVCAGESKPRALKFEGGGGGGAGEEEGSSIKQKPLID